MNLTYLDIPYKPHKTQTEFHASLAKFRLYSCGVGGGKTAAGANELLKWIIASRPCTYIMAAPTYNMLIRVTTPEFIKWCPRELIVKHNRSSHTIELVNGVKVVGIAGDRDDTIDRVRGMNIGGFWGDEISLCPEYMHEILIARMRDSHGCLKGWYTTTPKGRNWLHRMFVEHKRKDGTPVESTEMYKIFRGSTFDNPHTPDEFKQNLKATYVGVFAKQELYGEFVGYEGLVYPTFRRSLHVIDTSKMEFQRILGAVDFGFTNPQAALRVGLDHDGRMFILSEFYQRRITDSVFAEWASNNMKDCETIWADSENASGIREFVDKGLHCIGVVKKEGERKENFVTWGIKKVSARLEPKEDGKPRLYVDRKCVNTIMELENYRYPEGKEDQAEKENPLKVHDHLLDALRYLIVSEDGGSDGIKILEDKHGVIFGKSGRMF